MGFRFKKKPKQEENLPAISPEVLPQAEPQSEEALNDNLAALDAVAGDAKAGMKETLEEMHRLGIPLLSPEGIKYLFGASQKRMFQKMDNNPVLKELQNKSKNKELGDGTTGSKGE